ncbi:PREDICTED: atrial natriuretic peptide receptor 3-like, partial [Priapulus caudatus]|uniref:Atrial natriuretic peptide receptor 3-like n=1 Tax=Priapulus caudatus TaxID=37621 RepID=A0ABM1F7D8_PRICU
TRPVGYLCSYWNIPLISWVSSDPYLSGDNSFSTLARTLGPYSKLGSCFVKLFEHWRWTEAILVTRLDTSCRYVQKSIIDSFRGAGITLADQMSIPTDFQSTEEIDSMLDRIRLRGR